MSADQAANPLFQFFPLAVIFLIFYVLIFKPQRDKQSQLKKMIGNLKKNDNVVTTGGIHGTVVNLKDTTVVLRIDDNARMEVDKEAIVTVTKSAP